MKLLILLFSSCAVVFQLSAQVRIPAYSACLAPHPGSKGASYSAEHGITGWHDAKTHVLWFGELKAAGEITASVKADISRDKKSKLRLTIGDQKHDATVMDGTADFGSYEITGAGFVRFDLSSLNGKEDAGNIRDLLLDGPALKGSHFDKEPVTIIDMGAKLGPFSLTPILSDESGNHIKGIDVRDAKGGRIQFIEHEFSRENRVPEWQFSEIIDQVDANFDGFLDLQLADDGFTGRASRNQTYTFLTWDESARKFVPNNELTEACVRQIDPSGTLSTWGSDGGPYWDRATYRWGENKHLRLTEMEGVSSLTPDGIPNYSRHLYDVDGTETVIRGEDPREVDEETWKDGVWYDIQTFKNKKLIQKDRKLYHRTP